MDPQRFWFEDGGQLVGPLCPESMSLLVRPVRVGGPKELLLLEEDLDERIVKVGEVVHEGLYLKTSVR